MLCPKGADISTYYASNCYEVGGGNMGPLYLKCVGCQYVEVWVPVNFAAGEAADILLPYTVYMLLFSAFQYCVKRSLQ